MKFKKYFREKHKKPRIISLPINYLLKPITFILLLELLYDSLPEILSNLNLNHPQLITKQLSNFIWSAILRLVEMIADGWNFVAQSFCLQTVV